MRAWVSRVCASTHVHGCGVCFVYLCFHVLAHIACAWRYGVCARFSCVKWRERLLYVCVSSLSMHIKNRPWVQILLVKKQISTCSSPIMPRDCIHYVAAKRCEISKTFVRISTRFPKLTMGQYRHWMEENIISTVNGGYHYSSLTGWNGIYSESMSIDSI